MCKMALTAFYTHKWHGLFPKQLEHVESTKSTSIYSNFLSPSEFTRARGSCQLQAVFIAMSRVFSNEQEIK
jgi:hypothetical protein